MAQQTVERLQLGAALARLRETADKSQQHAAEALGLSTSRISQIEHAKGTLSVEELGRLLDFYGVQGSERETVLALGAVSRKRQKRRGYVDNLPQPFQRLTDLQASAEVVSWYECGVVPGLAQSPDYIRALLGSADSIFWETSEQETADRIEFRLQQQRQLLAASAPRAIKLIFTEDTLHHVVGGPSVMRGQVLHLLQMIEQHSRISVRVVPNAVPDNPALGGGLMVLDFAESTPVAFASVLHGPYTYYDQPADTDPMRRIIGRVEELALSVDDTRALLIGML